MTIPAHHGDDGDSRAATGRRRTRKTYRTNALGDVNVPERPVIEIKGIGRFGKSRRYCEDCGHPVGRCVCHMPDMPEAA